MSNKIKQSLRRSVGQLPRPDSKALWEMPIVPMKEHDYITRQEITGKSTSSMGQVMKFATGFACLFLVCVCGFGWYGQNLAINTVVSMDINPSVEITANKKHQVLSVVPGNEAAERILAGRSYKGWDIADTVETLTVSLGTEGYFEETGSAILLTVRGKKEDEAKALTRELSGKVRLIADTEETPTIVIAQTLPSKLNMDAWAKEHNVSVGKARLATELAALLPQYTREQLVQLPLETLAEALTLLGSHIPEGVVIEPSRFLTVETNVEPATEQTTEPTASTEAAATEAHIMEVPATTAPTVAPSEAKNETMAPVQKKPSPTAAVNPPTPMVQPTGVAPTETTPVSNDDDDDDDDDNDDNDDNDHNNDNNDWEMDRDDDDNNSDSDGQDDSDDD